MNIKVDNYSEINIALVNKIFNQGLVKEASNSFTGFVRTYLREQGILRRALPPEIVGPDDIDRVDWTDNPVKILEFQVDSKAYSVPFRGKGEMKEYHGKRAVVEIVQYETDTFHIEKQRMMTYRHPIQEVLIQQGILDLQKAEDETFIEALNKIATDNNKVATITTGGTLTWEGLVDAFKAFRASRPANRQVPIKTIIINENTYDDLKKLPLTMFAPTFNETVIREGNVGNIFNLNWVVTNKIDLVPDNTFYLLSDREYLGGFYLMQDATVYMKVEKTRLEWNIYELAGIGIVTDAILKVTLA